MALFRIGRTKPLSDFNLKDLRKESDAVQVSLDLIRVRLRAASEKEQRLKDLMNEPGIPEFEKTQYAYDRKDAQDARIKSESEMQEARTNKAMIDVLVEALLDSEKNKSGLWKTLLNMGQDEVNAYLREQAVTRVEATGIADSISEWGAADETEVRANRPTFND